MSDANITPLSEIDPEVEATLGKWLHDFRNQLAGLKLSAAWLKKSLLTNSLNVSEGIEVCEKMLQQIDVLTVQAKETTRSLKTPPKN